MQLKDYPIQYIRPLLLSDGTLVQLRPIHPRDREQADNFRQALSDNSIYNRFFGYVPTANEKLIRRLIDIDYRTEMAIIAETSDRPKQVISVARLVADGEEAMEYALIIADQWHAKGIGGLLTDYILEIAKDMGYQKVFATVLSQNTAMLEILRKQQFTLTPEDEQSIMATKIL